jgi:TonB-linked SusC/RagA family outer membrane protein
MNINRLVKRTEFVQEFTHSVFGRLLSVLMLLFVVQFFGAQTLAAQSKKVTLHLVNAPLATVLNDLSKQTHYKFFYSDNVTDPNQKVTLDVVNEPLNEVLDQIFKGTKIGFQLKNNQILLFKKIMESNSNANNPQQGEMRKITGKVTDEKGEAMPGVTIVEKGTTTGTITDTNGNYSFPKTSPNDILVFSFVGMQSQEVSVGNKNVINVALSESTTSLNEVVVVGYGTKLKSALTGSISTLGSEKIESRPVTGTMDALEGLISGVDISHTSGQPGQENYALSIRGISSINGNTPLILVDGVPGDINLINPNDIQDVTVLKDASAAIYGARAADGVILITTKGGNESGKPVVSYSTNFGMKSPSFLKKTTPTLHFVEMFNEANANDGDPQTFSDATIAKIKVNSSDVGPGENWGVESYPMFYQSKDWYRDLFREAMIQSHNLSISGGNDKTTYFLSGSFVNNQGNISVGSNYSNKYNYRVNVQTKLWKTIKLSAIVSYDYQNTLAPSALLNGGDYNDDAIDNALKVFSYVPEFNPTGNYYSYQGYGNPFQDILEGGYESTNDSRLNNNFKIDWTPIKGLVWTGQAAVNIENYGDKDINQTFYGYNWDNSINGLPRNDPNSAYFNNWSTTYKNFSTYINYNTIIANKHSISIMAGASQEKQEENQTYMSGSDFLSNQIFVLPLSNPKNLTAGSYWNDDSWALLSYFGRLSYSYDGKYYLDATVRKDGSSKFSPEKRWSGTYPSVAIAWKLSEEPFFKSNVPENIMDLLKVRASWGKTGNQDISALGLFDYYQLINIGGEYPIDGSSVSQLASMNGIASPTRTWETIQTKNLGFDLGFFHSKLTASFDIYRKNNTNMLVSVTYPTTLGATAPTTNAGNLVINGWELQGNWKSKIGDVQLNVGLILDYNKDILTNLQGSSTFSLGENTAVQGYPMNSFFGYKGSIIRSQAELDTYAAKFAGKGIVPATQPNGYKGLGVGDVMYQDIDGDGTITTYGNGTKGSTGDAVFLGSADPKYTYSVNAGLEYKNFDLGIIIQGTGDKYAWHGNGNFGVPLAYSWFQPLDYFYGKTFSQDNLNAQYPRLSNSGTVKNNNYQCSSIYMVNTKYLRFKNITIGYNIPRKFLNTLKINSARIYFSGEDLFTISPGTWGHDYDPEESNTDYNYPFYKTFSLGLNVNL